MIVSSVVDPSSYNESLYGNEVNLLEMVNFLRGMLDNGILLFDESGMLTSALNNEVSKLSQGARRKITTLTVELKKNNKFIKMPIAEATGNTEKLIYSLVQKCTPDTVLVGNKNYIGVPITRLEGYSYSDFEIKIKKQKCFTDKGSTLQINDKLDGGIVFDAIDRCIKYSSIVKLYDKQIGKNIKIEDVRKYDSGADNRVPLERAYWGIKHILEVWCSSDVPILGKILEIYTVYDERDHGGESKPKEKIARILKTYLKDKLTNEFPSICINIRLYSDRHGKYHARFLESKYAIVSFDRGFDLFYRDGRTGSINYKHNEMSLKSLDHDTGYRSGFITQV